MERVKESLPQRLLLRVPEAAEVLGFSRAFVYELIAKKELPMAKVGGTVCLSYTTLQKLVSEHEN
jgi:excisionase family DNA binding protein